MAGIADLIARQGQLTPDPLRGKGVPQGVPQQAVRQQQTAMTNAVNQARIAGQYGQYQGFNRPEPQYANWYGSDLSGIDWGQLGPGYQGPPRGPNSPNPAGRFDTNPASALAFSQLSNEQAAQDFHRGAMLHGTPGFEGANDAPLRSGLGAAALGMTPNTGMGALPNMQRYATMSPSAVQSMGQWGQPDVGQYYDPQQQRLYLQSGVANNPYIADALGMGYTLDQLRSMGPAEAALTFGNVIANREAKNQRPGRFGFADLLGMAAAPALGMGLGALGLPAMLAGALGSAGGSALTGGNPLRGGVMGAIPTPWGRLGVS